jgi:hypothetical protein
VSPADKFPHHLREEHAKRVLNVGSVLRMHVTFTKPPKIKILILNGIDIETEVAAFVCGNSKKDFASHASELDRLQCPLKESIHSFLIRDSFVDCSKLFLFNLPAIREAVLNNTELLRDPISPVELSKLRSIYGSARTISAHIKKRFGLLN